ncbi:LPXTG cell wall anchor domain-containing protein [Lactobacillus mellis]|uniref:LPXTG cell wall anchor domain-containing protein n=1 Tax=Bombilactobacillus mellis TaxID=1218508 RepID=UPI00157FF977|nr:LPXTG cell wall anchor domain-containing protein [Bombilactobacillus mellis]NUG39746.1 LPXTG cell wall anchor domain-containing protein [Bombilactobacillus mellis]
MNEVQEVIEIPSNNNDFQSDQNQNHKTQLNRNIDTNQQQSSYVMEEYPATGDNIENSFYISIIGILLLVITLFYSLRRLTV